MCVWRLVARTCACAPPQRLCVECVCFPCALCVWRVSPQRYEFVGDADVDPYSLSAPVCASDGLGTQRQRLLDALPARRRFPNGFPPTNSRRPRALARQAKAPATAGTGAAAAADDTETVEYRYEPCWEGTMTAYLNRPDVRAALHVDHARTWADCDDGVFDHYDAASSAAPMESTYLKLVRGYDYASLGMAPLKLLVFSGDDDAVCGTHGTLSWVLALGLKVESYWQPWHFQDQDYGTRLAGQVWCDKSAKRAILRQECARGAALTRGLIFSLFQRLFAIAFNPIFIAYSLLL